MYVWFTILCQTPMIVAIFFFSIYAQLLTAIEFILEDHLWFPGGGVTVEIVRDVSTVTPPQNLRLSEYALPVSASKVPSYLCPWLDPVHFKVTLRAVMICVLII
jgi:hypothetical protein